MLGADLGEDPPALPASSCMDTGPKPVGPTTLAPSQGLERPENPQLTAAYYAGNGGALASTAGFRLT